MRTWGSRFTMTGTFAANTGMQLFQKRLSNQASALMFSFAHTISKGSACQLLCMECTPEVKTHHICNVFKLKKKIKSNSPAIASERDQISPEAANAAQAL